MIARELFFGATCLIGIAFLVGAVLLRWQASDRGWRAALFSAGFGSATLGAMAPFQGPVLGLAMLVVAATAQVYVGLLALRRQRPA